MLAQAQSHLEKKLEVRQLAGDIIVKIIRGEDPNLEKRTLRQELTLGELFKLALDTDFKLHNRTWQAQEARFKCHLACWESRRISTITRVAAQSLHTQIGAMSGPYEANRVLSLLSRLFNIARIRGLELQNPCVGIKKFREISRERFLQAEELPRFFEAVYTEENSEVRDFVLLALFTGARKRNVLSMRWKDVDLERAIWTIPGETTKNGRTASIPLCQQALNVLRSRSHMKSESDYVLPGPGMKGFLNDPKKGWARICQNAGITGLRIHDLRRTFGSWQAATGASLTVIGKSLNHKSLVATQVYARLELDPVRVSIEKAIEAMVAAGNGNKSSKIVPIRGGAEPSKSLTDAIGTEQSLKHEEPQRQIGSEK